VQNTWEKQRSTQKIFVLKYEGKGPPKRQRHRLQDNIKIDLKEQGWETATCIHLAKDYGQG
jgi:hypothetical protein